MEGTEASLSCVHCFSSLVPSSGRSLVFTGQGQTPSRRDLTLSVPVSRLRCQPSLSGSAPPFTARFLGARPPCPGSSAVRGHETLLLWVLTAARSLGPAAPRRHHGDPAQVTPVCSPPLPTSSSSENGGGLENAPEVLWLRRLPVPPPAAASCPPALLPPGLTASPGRLATRTFCRRLCRPNSPPCGPPAGPCGPSSDPPRALPTGLPQAPARSRLPDALGGPAWPLARSFPSWTHLEDLATPPRSWSAPH